MNSITENPYKAPEAELITSHENLTIRDFKRFSAWAVFGLSVITFNIYPIYWLYSRALTINSTHKSKIPTALLIAFAAISLISIVVDFIPQIQTTVYPSWILQIGYFAIYLTVLFKVHNRLKDIIGESGNSAPQLNSVLTFFFNVIYLQFKINECIDNDGTLAVKTLSTDLIENTDETFTVGKKTFSTEKEANSYASFLRDVQR